MSILVREFPRCWRRLDVFSNKVGGTKRTGGEEGKGEEREGGAREREEGEEGANGEGGGGCEKVCGGNCFGSSEENSSSIANH